MTCFALLKRHFDVILFIVEMNYVCADFIGNSITKITSNKGRGPKAKCSPILFVFNFIFEIMLRNHVRRLEQRTFVPL